MMCIKIANKKCLFLGKICRVIINKHSLVVFFLDDVQVVIKEELNYTIPGEPENKSSLKIYRLNL